MPDHYRLPAPEHSYVRTGDVALHSVTIPGQGPDMILIHGVGMDWRVWQAVSRRLHPSFRLHLVDLRGHGQSDKPDAGYTLAHYAADIEDFIGECKLERAILVGSSLGGMVTASVEAPADIVSHRVLVDPPLTGGPILDADILAKIRKLKHEPPRLLTAYLARFNPGAGTHLMKTISEMWHQAADGVIDAMLAQQSDYYAIDSALRGIESPTLLMRADPSFGAVLTADNATQALQLLAHGKETVVKGAGHAIHAYKPAEFAHLVRTFVHTGDVSTGARTVGRRDAG